MDNRIATALVVVLIVVALPAFAHTGVTPTSGFAAGLGHPLSGVDHLLAMFAVGVWASMLGGRAVWMVPAIFVSTMIIGGMLGILGVGLPVVEFLIIFSVIVLGLIIALNINPPIVLVALFALAHGHAHGTEMPADASGYWYGLGFVAATALIHALGIGMGRFTSITVLRVGGVAIAATGVILMIFQ